MVEIGVLFMPCNLGGGGGGGGGCVWQTRSVFIAASIPVSTKSI